MSELDRIERERYLVIKRLEVLEMIKPYCELFKIRDYDYIIVGGRELLKLDDTLIGCSSNSMFAIKEELLGYIFITYYTRWLGAFDKQTTNHIKQYWLKDGE